MATNTPIVQRLTPATGTSLTSSPRPAEAQPVAGEKSGTFLAGVIVLGAAVLWALFLLLFKGKDR